MMATIGEFLILLLDLYIYVIIASVIVSWLIAFDVINARNEKAANLLRLLDRATEPVYRPIRKYVPPIAGIDLTPIIVIFGIYILQRMIVEVFIF